VIADEDCDEIIIACCCVTIARNKQLLAEAGVVGPLAGALKTHLQSSAVMEQACAALKKIFIGGEWKRQ